MFTKLRDLVQNFLSRGHSRSVKAKKNILSSLFIKGFSIITSLFMVPLTLNYVQESQYGIWLTLSSIVAWFSLFDIGLGNGLRNKLSMALAKNDLTAAKTYISSTYAIMAVIFGSLLILFNIIAPFLNWAGILNTSDDLQQLKIVASITFSFFCLNFVLELLYYVFFAFQRPAITNLFRLIVNIVSVTIIFILTKTTEGSLVNLAFVMGGVPFLILCIASMFFYTGRYKAIRPSINYVRKSHFKDLVGLGVKFFLVSIAGLIIFSTDNVIIIQLFDPTEVPPYNIAHKYFNVLGRVFSIISLPFWSAYTEAWIKQDINWIVGTNKALLKVWWIILLAGVLMFLGSDIAYRYWVPNIEIPFTLSLLMMVFVLIMSFGSIYVTFINGVGKIKLQLIAGLAGALVNIPLSILFAKYCELGTAGVIMASIISIAYGPLIAPIQYRKIINGTASGIWDK